MTTGKGIYAKVGGKKLLCGNEAFLLENGINIEKSVQNVLEESRSAGKASILVAEGEKCIGVLAMSDVLRPEAKDMLKQLHRMNTNIVLLTGDNLPNCRT